MVTSRQIAIIEDDAPVRQALGSLLRSMGYETSSHESAVEFLRSGALENAHCIVTDIQMPGISGIELKQILVARGVRIPVIMITARPEAELHARALANEAYCLLKKPFEPVELMECISRALRE